jgi:hypothetical protein
MKIFTPQTYTKSQLEQLSISEISFPFNDDDATYDGLTHRYTLTKKYFEERGVNLQEAVQGSSPDKINQFLKETSRKVYLYIYTHSKSSRQQLNYMIAKRGILGYNIYEYRQAFLEAMFVEGCYLLANGDISNTTGIDLDTMQNLSQDVVRKQDRDMHKDCILDLKILGLNYYGRYNFVPQGEDW